jgi:ribosomal protein S18 acetylase RimI-like enzyme
VRTPTEPDLVDLDQRPDLTPAVLALFAAAVPGRDHVVTAIPSRMGMPPTLADLERSLGTVIFLENDKAAGALSICPYSDEQVTLWGPVFSDHRHGSRIAPWLMRAVRRALHAGNFESMRALVDTRNRRLRDVVLSLGFTQWKDNHVYERALTLRAPASAPGVRLALRRDHRAVSQILTEAFPDSEHCRPNLLARESEGYRHYLLEDNATIVAAAAVQDGGPRSWLKLISTRSDHRGKEFGKRLLAGICYGEAREGPRTIGLEVLADNPGAIRLFEGQGFLRSWTASILVAPV